MTTPKIEKPCRHTHQSVGRFLTAFAWATKPEDVGYCWDCGSLKRDNVRWQYTSKQERVRKRYRVTQAARARSKR